MLLDFQKKYNSNCYGPYSQNGHTQFCFAALSSGINLREKLIAMVLYLRACLLEDTEKSEAEGILSY